MAQLKRIGVLTSGGDAPGMNSAIRAVTRTALSYGVEVFGILGGYSGLVNDKVRPLTARDVSGIESLGGTILYTDRCDEFKTEEGMQKAVETCKKYQLDGIVACGGDGTFRGATDLSNRGIPTIGVPCTIDNDIASSEFSIGYDTAMNTAIEAIDKLRDTCESHGRCNVVEVMGNKAGGIAIQSAIACGAVGCVIVERPFDEEALYEKMKTLRADGKRGFIVVVSEMIPFYASEEFAKKVEECTGIETRFARLAHVVRGGYPSLRDRVTAAKMGSEAVKELLCGKTNLVICERDNKIVSIDINLAQTADRIYKGKDDFKAMNKYPEEDKARIRKIVDSKKKFFKDMTVLLADLTC